MVNGIEVVQDGDGVTVLLQNGAGVTASRWFSVADTWNICQELGAAARRAQQHSSKAQAAAAGVKTSAAPKIGRQPEDWRGRADDDN